MKNKRLNFILMGTASILLIPLLSMQFTDQVNWSVSDFIIAGFLLLTAGLLWDLIIRKTRNKRQRIMLYGLLLAGLLLIWAELAVGVFGSPFAGN